MFSKFSEEAQKSLLLAREEMIKLRHPYIGSEHLLLAILSNKNLPITKMLSKYNINYENFYNEIKKIIKDMEECSLEELDIEFTDGTKIKMKKMINRVKVDEDAEKLASLGGK